MGNGNPQISPYTLFPVARDDLLYFQIKIISIPASRWRFVQSALKVDVFFCFQLLKGIVIEGAFLVGEQARTQKKCGQKSQNERNLRFSLRKVGYPSADEAENHGGYPRHQGGRKEGRKEYSSSEAQSKEKKRKKHVTYY
jgi:hypothetical protein